MFVSSGEREQVVRAEEVREEDKEECMTGGWWSTG
jgi:hypothetical protein